MDFTGERFVPTFGGEIKLEHYLRYAAVKDLVVDKKILDLACGEGFGSNYLSDFGKKVVGVDLSYSAIKHAKSKYIKKNLDFIQASATNLPFINEDFDIVVSFETIEHLEEQDEMLSEIVRVLKPDGCLIISSPNKPIYNKYRIEPNEYHLKELDFDELNLLLKKYFVNIDYYGQKISTVSLLQHLKDKDKEYISFIDDDNISNDSPSLINPEYFVAICSKSVIKNFKLKQTLLFPKKNDLGDVYNANKLWALNTNIQIKKTKALNSSMTEELSHKTTEINQLLAQIKKTKALNLSMTEELSHKTTKIEEYEKIIENIYLSTSWRITHVLRIIKSYLNRLFIKKTFFIEEIKKIYNYFFKGLYILFKKIYFLIPISHKARNTHRRIIFKFFPNLFIVKSKNNDSKLSDKLENIIKSDLLTSKITFPETLKPIVSIIIPIYGKIEYTMKCLKSIEQFQPKCSFEIVLVDDFSQDTSFEILKKYVKGIKIIRNTKNLGFVNSCNIGAIKSKGSFLYFLNNDTVVSEGWLDSLLNTYENIPDVGLVGSKLIYPDGSLQEAGGIVWNDGSAWNYGRNSDPNLSIYNYTREADYCSGASILIKKTLFKKIGMFDTVYSPAYCEDTDLCFKVRAQNLKVIYEPSSCVIHFEGISNGKDLNAGIKSYQIKNQKKFLNRWKKELIDNHFPNGTNVIRARDRNNSKKTILIIDHYIPEFDMDAGSRTIKDWINMLLMLGYQVKLWPYNQQYKEKYAKYFQSKGVEVAYGNKIADFASWIQNYSDSIDYYFLSRPEVAISLLKIIKKYSKSKILYYGHDIHHLRIKNQMKILKNTSSLQSKYKYYKTIEESVWRRVDSIVYLNENEKSYVNDFLISENIDSIKLWTLPAFIYPDSKISKKKLIPERKDILIVAGFQHEPNVDGLLWFVNNVYPKIISENPDAFLQIIGSNPPPEVRNLNSHNIAVHGYVDDNTLDDFYFKSRVAIAPLRYGGGVKGKVIEAIKHGVPIVTTSIGAQGISIEESGIIVSDKAENFSISINNIINDDKLWNKHSSKHLKYARKYLSYNAVINKFKLLFSE